MGEMPSFKSLIAQAYEKPVLRPLVGETQQLEAKYLPTIYNTFANAGTGAADLSPAAKLQQIGKGLGNLGARVLSNRDIQQYFGTQIDNLAALEMQKWQDRQQRLKDLYSMAFQREQMEEARRQAAAARAAQASQGSALAEYISRIMGGGGGGGEGDVALGTPQSVGQLNALREAEGLPPVSQEYFDTTYRPQYQAPESVLSSYVAYPQELMAKGQPWYKKAAGVALAPGALTLHGISKIFG